MSTKDVPVKGRAVSFDIKMSNLTNASESIKSKIVDDMRDAALSSFYDIRFVKVSDTQLKSAIGVDSKGLLKGIADQQTFGSRGLALQSVNGVTFLNKSGGFACTHHQGAVSAIVITSSPASGIASDAGSLGVMVYAVGSCAKLNDIFDDWIDEIVDEVSSAAEKS